MKVWGTKPRTQRENETMSRLLRHLAPVYRSALAVRGQRKPERTLAQTIQLLFDLANGPRAVRVVRRAV
jgi:hypothetical protein